MQGFDSENLFVSRNFHYRTEFFEKTDKGRLATTKQKMNNNNMIHKNHLGHVTNFGNVCGISFYMKNIFILFAKQI